MDKLQHAIAVEAACADASGSAVAGILNDSTAFEKDEVAQGRLADLISGRLIKIDENRRLRIDPECQLLKAKLASEERQIGKARERYNDTARSYNEKLRSFPRRSFAAAMHYAPARCW
jgi:LemA protein